MIQPLRTAHRRLFVALAFVLAAILLIGLGARRPQAAHTAAKPISTSPDNTAAEKLP
jgi:hypothetical protein